MFEESGKKKFADICTFIRVLLLLSLVMFLFMGPVSFADGGTIAFPEKEYSVPVGWNGKTIVPTAQGINSWLRYEYYSDDTSIAVVDNYGNVRGVEGGATTIHCKGVNPTTNEEYEASYSLTVTIPVASLSVEQTSISLGVTNVEMKDMNPELRDFFYHTPKVTVVPENASNKTLQWSSSNENVAVVDADGIIKAVGPGGATITGRVTDGGWVSVNINVNVPKTFVSATNIRVTGKEPVLFGCIARGGTGHVVGTEVSPSGIRRINEKWEFGTTGDCFTLKRASEYDAKKSDRDRYSNEPELMWYHIVPQKAGQGTIRYVVNGGTVFSVTVTVDKAAVE